MVHSVVAAAVARNSGQTGTEGTAAAGAMAERELQEEADPEQPPTTDERDVKASRPAESRSPNGISAANTGSATRIGCRRQATASATRNGAATRPPPPGTLTALLLTASGHSRRPPRPSSAG